MEKYLTKTINECLSASGSQKPIIDTLIQKFKLYYDKPVNSIQEINQRQNKKIKGDIFELLCKFYFSSFDCYKHVWLLKEVPKETLELLSLKRNDLGIDLVLQNKDDTYSAVQVKYRFPNKYKSKNVVGWKQLSTFYSIVNRSGPYKKHIIFTNADYVRHVGKKDPKDKTIAIGTLRRINRQRWCKMVGHKENVLKITSTFKKLSLEEIRQKRIEKLSGIQQHDQD